MVQPIRREVDKRQYGSQREDGSLFIIPGLKNLVLL